MKAALVEVLNFGAKSFGSIVLDCSYLDLIRMDKSLPRSSPPNKHGIRVNGVRGRTEVSRLIIGVTKPDGEYLELCASIDMIHPLEARATLSVDYGVVDQVPVGSEIKLLRYQVVN